MVRHSPRAQWAFTVTSTYDPGGQFGPHMIRMAIRSNTFHCSSLTSTFSGQTIFSAATESRAQVHSTLSKIWLFQKADQSWRSSNPGRSFTRSHISALHCADSWTLKSLRTTSVLARQPCLGQDNSSQLRSIICVPVIRFPAQNRSLFRLTELWGIPGLPSARETDSFIFLKWHPSIQ
jgi:hypothetical protein